MLDFLNDRYLNHINLNHIPLIRHNISLLLLEPWFSHLEKLIVDSIIFDVSSSSKMRFSVINCLSDCPVLSVLLTLKTDILLYAASCSRVKREGECGERKRHNVSQEDNFSKMANFILESLRYCACGTFIKLAFPL